MCIRLAALAALIALLAAGGPAFADSVTATSGPNGTTIVNGEPCRVVTGHGGSRDGTNSTTITAGGGQVSGSTTVSPGGSGTGSSVSVGSGSSSDGAHVSSAAGSDCVIHRDK